MWVVASEILHEFVVVFCGFQNDFILEDGLMRVNGGEAIVPNVIKAVEIARHRGVLVVWVIFFCFLLILVQAIQLSFFNKLCFLLGKL